MNVFLLMYLNYVRGPRILAERQRKEEEERLLKEEQDRANGVVAQPKTCKKCDELIIEKGPPQHDLRLQQLCKKCLVIELADMKAKEREFNQAQQELKLTPFVVIQLFIICLALSVFLYRNFFMKTE